MLLRRPRTSEAIKAIFVAQLAMAAWLVGHDMLAALPRLFLADSAEELTVPIRPGDQTRRFDPLRLPPLPAAPGTRVFPELDAIPPRLQFRPLGAGEAALLGDIAEGDGQRFADWLAGLEVPPRKLWLHSPGGAVTDALAIGRTLRAAGIATGVAPGDVCFSACPYILAGGVLRDADPAAMVGVHQHYFGENTALPAFLAVQDIQLGQADVAEYLAEMGIDLRLMLPAMRTPPEEIYVLTEAELERFRLVTAEGPP